MLRADNLTAIMCRLSQNLGVSTSWNLQGLSRPVQGLIYLYLCHAHDDGYVCVAEACRTINICVQCVDFYWRTDGLNTNVCVHDE